MRIACRLLPDRVLLRLHGDVLPRIGPHVWHARLLGLQYLRSPHLPEHQIGLRRGAGERAVRFVVIEPQAKPTTTGSRWEDDEFVLWSRDLTQELRSVRSCMRAARSAAQRVCGWAVRKRPARKGRGLQGVGDGGSAVSVAVCFQPPHLALPVLHFFAALPCDSGGRACRVCVCARRHVGALIKIMDWAGYRQETPTSDPHTHRLPQSHKTHTVLYHVRIMVRCVLKCSNPWYYACSMDHGTSPNTP